MRVQCDVCEKNKAAVMCCADEAALCTDCDTRVHAANKLANKHVRIPLIGGTESPCCDICQEKTAFFFCLEDRALLCRDCDVSIHTANTLSSNHQRFLITGIRVALDAICRQDVTDAVSEEPPRASPSTTASPPSIFPKTATVSAKPEPSPTHKLPASTPSYGSPFSGKVPARERTKPSGTTMNFGEQNSSMLTRRNSITDFLSDAVPVWRVEEFLNLPELADGYNIGDIGSSKADMNNLGDFDWTADLSLFEEQMYAESFHEVPQMPSPPTTTGLSRSGRATAVGKGKAKQDAAFVPDFEDAFIVPDLGLQTSPVSPPIAKRRRTCYDNIAL